MQLNTLGSSRPTPSGTVVWSLGFRPFFLGAMGGALVLIMAWLLALSGGGAPSTYYGARLWHSHEMIFGYTVAVIAGFLLTAVRNWAEVPTPTGKPLMGLFALWLAGRLLGGVTPVPAPLLAAVDLAFLPTLLLSLALPLARAGKLNTPPALINMVAISLLGCANLLVHLQCLGVTTATATTGLNLAIGVIVLLIGAVGGRMIPLFISRQIPGPQTVSVPARIALPSLGVLLLVELSGLPAVVIGLAGLVAAVANGARLWDWYRPGIWRQGLLWVLWVGYGWLVVGLALKSLAYWGVLPFSVATHALTAGAIGGLTLGMMARVSLGHSGQPMRPDRRVVLGFVLLNLAALVRVVGPLMVPAAFLPVMYVTGALWLLTFVLLLRVYWPILLNSPETDES